MVADDVTWGVRGDPGRLRRPLVLSFGFGPIGPQLNDSSGLAVTSLSHDSKEQVA